MNERFFVREYSCAEPYEGAFVEFEEPTWAVVDSADREPVELFARQGDAQLYANLLNGGADEA